MFVDSAYWHHSRLDFKDKTHPLFVGSVGTYRLISRPKLPTHRPKGRVDFQLLYIAAGRAHFYFEGKEEIVCAGSMVVYRPREEQRYCYYGVDHTEVFWVHFTGHSVTNILRSYGIEKGVHVIHTGTSLEFKRIFTQMIEEMRGCQAHYEEMLVCQLRMLFILIQRVGEQRGRKRGKGMDPQLEEARRFFDENYQQAISIEDYASAHGMSVSWFIRLFKEAYGSTPAQYILSMRISRAQSLLEDKRYNVSEVGALVGYENAFYFSRLFKKQTGMSPREFRQRMEEAEAGVKDRENPV